MASNKEFNVDKERRLKLDDATSKKLLRSITSLEERVNLLGK